MVINLLILDIPIVSQFPLLGWMNIPHIQWFDPKPAKRNTQTEQEKITITTKSIQENLHAAGKSAETFLADKMHLYAFVFLHVFALRLIIAEVKSIGVQHSWFLHVVTLYSSYCSIL